MDVEPTVGTSSEEMPMSDEFQDFNVPQPSVKQVVDSLMHSCRCKETSCRVTSCPKMKRVVQHTKVCKRKVKGGCATCKQLIAVCCQHAKTCEEVNCQVTFCRIVKLKLETLHKTQKELADMGKMLAMEMHMQEFGVESPGRATAPTSEKDWHKKVADSIRNNIITKLAEALSPVPMTNLPSQEKDNFIKKAEVLEFSVYEKSYSRSEYYTELARMLSEMTKEKEEREIEAQLVL